MNKKHSILKYLFFVAVIFVLIFISGYVYFVVIHKADVVTGLSELRQQVSSDVEAGKDSTYIIVKDVSKNDIYYINKYVGSPYGVVDNYRVIRGLNDFSILNINYTISDNYYVLHKVLDDKEIPQDKKRAQEIYEVVNDFLSTEIKPTMNDFEKELAAHDYIVKNCDYGYGENELDAYTTYGVFVLGKAVCDGYAQAFSMLLDCMGIENNMVVGSASQDLHAWNQVMISDKWYNVDITWDDNVEDMGNMVKHSYFNITDDDLEISHEWEREGYSKCQDNEWNYFNVTGKVYENNDDFKSKASRVIDGKNLVEFAIKDFSKDDFSLSYIYGMPAIGEVSYSTEKRKGYTVITVFLDYKTSKK